MPRGRRYPEDKIDRPRLILKHKAWTSKEDYDAGVPGKGDVEIRVKILPFKPMTAEEASSRARKRCRI